MRPVTKGHSRPLEHEGLYYAALFSWSLKYSSGVGPADKANQPGRPFLAPPASTKERPQTKATAQLQKHTGKQDCGVWFDKDH